MNEVREEIAALRRDVEALQTEIRSIRVREEASVPGPMDLDVLIRKRLHLDLANAHKSAGIAVYRMAVATDGKGGTGSYHSIFTWSRPDELPSAGRLRDSVAAFVTDPLVPRVVRALAEALYDGNAMRLTKSELAARLDTDAGEIDQALQPLVADKTLRLSSDENGEEAYEIQSLEALLVLSLE